MKTLFPRIMLLLTAAAYVGFALWLGIRPGALLEAFGMEQETPAMLTEIRAFYGGLEMGIVAAILLVWRRGDLGGALLVGGIPLGGAAIGRGLGLVLDGYSSLHAGFAVAEAVSCGLCVVGYFLTRNEFKTPPLRSPERGPAS